MAKDAEAAHVIDASTEAPLDVPVKQQDSTEIMLAYRKCTISMARFKYSMTEKGCRFAP